MPSALAAVRGTVNPLSGALSTSVVTWAMSTSVPSASARVGEAVDQLSATGTWSLSVIVTRATAGEPARPGGEAPAGASTTESSSSGSSSLSSVMVRMTSTPAR